MFSATCTSCEAIFCFIVKINLSCHHQSSCLLLFPCGRYSHKNLSFGIVDLGLFPNAAERFGIYFGGKIILVLKLFITFTFSIIHISVVTFKLFCGNNTLAGSMDQLPTYILFENAAEVSRIPQFDIEAKSSHPPITKVISCSQPGSI